LGIYTCFSLAHYLLSLDACLPQEGERAWVRVNISSQAVAIALIEAKKSNEPPDKGLEQAKKYARLNHVPFVYSSNGHLFVECLTPGNFREGI
jgi:hypothetical protein